MKYYFFVIAFVCISASYAQVTIKGNVDNNGKHLIRLIQYSDQFSMLETTLDTDTCDNKTGFFLEAEISNTGIAVISSDLDKAEIVLSPNDKLKIKINIPQTNEYQSVYEKSPLTYEIISGSKLNSKIEEFNTQYNTFLLQNFNKLTRARNNKLIEEFRLFSDSAFAEYNNEFFNNYRKYRIANLELSIRMQNEAVIIEKYFYEKEILYNNIEYTSLFKQVFQNYIFSGQSGINYAKLIETINNSTSFKTFDELISNGNFKLASDTRLRELVGIISLSKLYNNREFSRGNIIKLLRQIERNSKFQEHRYIAGNYIKKLQYLTAGSTPPYFKLKSEDGSEVSINNYKSKFLLLSFMEEGSKICLSQLNNLDEIQQVFKSDLDILILVKGEASQIKQFISDRDYNWKVARVKDILLLEKFMIKVFPTYFLINPDGSIASNSTPMPDENLANYISSFMKRWHSKHEK